MIAFGDLQVVSAPDLATRPAVKFLNYAGDVTAGFDPEQPVGPTTMGEALWPVSSTYDPELKRTRVGFSYIAPPTLARCRVCGCTEITACLGGCSWVEADLCSRCSLVTLS